MDRAPDDVSGGTEWQNVIATTARLVRRSRTKGCPHGRGTLTRPMVPTVRRPATAGEGLERCHPALRIELGHVVIKPSCWLPTACGLKLFVATPSKQYVCREIRDQPISIGCASFKWRRPRGTLPSRPRDVLIIPGIECWVTDAELLIEIVNWNAGFHLTFSGNNVLLGELCPLQRSTPFVRVS